MKMRLTITLVVLGWLLVGCGSAAPASPVPPPVPPTNSPIISAAPPRTAPESIPPTPAGFWAKGWAASADGQRMAWLEAEPVPGDWSQRLPTGCCGDPAPRIRAIVVWERQSGQMQRFFVEQLPVVALSWLADSLYWRADNATLLFTGRPEQGSTDAALYSLSLKGEVHLLAQHPHYGRITMLAEGSDESLYYAAGFVDANPSQLMRRHTDGRTDILQSGLLICSRDSAGHLIVHEGVGNGHWVAPRSGDGRNRRHPLSGAGHALISSTKQAVAHTTCDALSNYLL
jgi:hypothetical protein